MEIKRRYITPHYYPLSDEKILVINCSCFFLNQLSASEMHLSDVDVAEPINVLSRALPDSLNLRVKGHPAIFYSYGHYGYKWSLIVKTESGFNAFSGKMSYLGHPDINQLTEENRIDSAKLFSKNCELLTWAFDSISTEGIDMKRIRRAPYTGIYKDLSVINSEGRILFSSDDAAAFSGPDSLNFNKRFLKLCLIMYWLSEPKIREYIPESTIY